MILLYASVAAAYLAAAWIEWRRLSQPASPESTPVATISRWLPLLAIAGHAILVLQAIFTDQGLDLSLANALSAVAGLTALFAWLGRLSGTLPGVAAGALPVAAAGVLLPAAFPNPHRFSFTAEPWAALHIAVALSAYALLIVAALQALVLLGFEKRLHRGVARRQAAVLRPPPVPGLAADPCFLARLDRPHPGDDQLPVQRLGLQPPLASSPSRTSTRSAPSSKASPAPFAPAGASSSS